MSEKTRPDLDERIVEIETERLRDFRNHPFKIKEDQQMEELVESIQKYPERMKKPVCVLRRCLWTSATV